MNSISYVNQGICIRCDGDAKNIKELARSYLIRGYDYDTIRTYPKYLEIMLYKPV